MSYITVDIDIDEIYDSMSKHVKEDMFYRLKEEGFVDEEMYLTGNESLSESFLKEDLIKIFKNIHQLTLEDEELIKQIAKQL